MNNAKAAMTVERIAEYVYPAHTDEHKALKLAVKSLRMDPLDIAYLSMGALQALDADNGKAYDWLNPHASLGQDGMIAEVLDKCMPAVQQVWDEQEGEYDGMFLYDVVEPLGMWFIREWVRRQNPPSAADCLNQCRKWANE